MSFRLMSLKTAIFSRTWRKVLIKYLRIKENCINYTMSWYLRGVSGGLEPPSYRDNPHTIYPVESTIPFMFCRLVRYHQFESHAYRRILLSVSSHAANVPLRTTLKIHRGRLSATSPAHHRMAINHLLHRLGMMCFLALGATQRESMITTQRVVDALICLFIKGFPCTWFFKVWASRSRTYEEHYLFELKTYPCLPYI